jgi:hypothetical protein
MRFTCEWQALTSLEYPLGPWTINAPETEYDGTCWGPCCYGYWEEEDDCNGNLLSGQVQRDNW